MKILVVEDNPLHQAHAMVLKHLGHDLTVLGSYDDAMAVMPEGEKIPYDVVLTDMLMPISRLEMVAPGAYDYATQVPYGVFIVLQAASCGAKFAAMATDADAHRDPLSSAVRCRLEGKTFVINGTRCMFRRAPRVEGTRFKDWERILTELLAEPPE